MFESITETCREVPDHLRCRHILDEGHRCGSYALRNEHFCYYHHADRKPAPDPQARYARRNSITLPAPTSRAAIQEAIGNIIISLASNDIDRRRAGLLLYGLQLAALNIARHREDQTHTNELSSQQDDASAPQDSTSTPTRSHPSPISCHPSSKAEDLRFSQPATNAPEPNQQTDPFTEEVFPLPKPKLYPLPRAGAALLLRSLAQHLNVEPSPGTPEDRRTEPTASETTETILPALSAVAVVSSPPTRHQLTSSRPKQRLSRPLNSRHLDRSAQRGAERPLYFSLNP